MAIENELKPIATAYPAGHFYSPVVDPRFATVEAARLWPEPPPAPLGIDFNDASHREILSEMFPRFMPGYDFPESVADPDNAIRFFTRNSQFSWLDARALFVLLRAWRPERVIEVGSGYSSLLMAETNRRYLDGKCWIHCIEPYPRPFLLTGIRGLAGLTQAKVQDVSLAFFEQLRAGDVLFIDSSHVAKTGSDVNHLYFEVLPRLASGVRVHIHDIFMPHDYPREWVIDENRSWNEQYLLRALLMHSHAFRVLFGCSYAFASYPDLVRLALAHPRGHGFAGGSFWIEKT